MRKTVSLAMTTYNGEKYLREQLDSIYNQTMVPDEVIVCDDNSKDGTVEILEEYHKAKGLKYYVNNPGLGVNKNFFKAISLCSCDYIALSDQDDVWFPVKIETLYYKMLEIDNGTPCAVSSQSDDMDSNGNIINKRTTKEDTEGYAASLLKKGVHQGCTMIINQPLSQRVIDLVSSDDCYDSIMFDALISYCAAIFGVKYNLGVSLMNYRHHSTNVFANNKSKNNLRNKIKSYITFPGFILDIRIKDLSILYEKFEQQITNPDVKCLLSIISRINNSNCFFHKLALICTIKEYSFIDRIAIVIRSLVLSIVKPFI